MRKKIDDNFQLIETHELMHVCDCGCGNIPKSKNSRYCMGHNPPWNINLTKETDTRVAKNAKSCRKPKQVKEIEILSDGRIIEHKYTREVRQKLGENRKGEKNNFYRHTHSIETCKQIGISRSKKPFKTGWKHTEEANEKNRQKHLGKKPWNFGKHLSAEHVKHIFEANLWNKDLNGSEVCLDDFLNLKFPNKCSFTGTGKMFIAGRCPDWKIKGKKKLIELFGNFWHGEYFTGRTKEQEEKQRIDHFAKYGYKTLIIWEYELKNLKTLETKIENFIKGE